MQTHYRRTIEMTGSHAKAQARIAAALILACLGVVLTSKAIGSDYVNPIIHADYSDPDAIRVGEDYWLTSSSFVNTPGLPILHSRDLVNWEIVNHALRSVPPEEYFDGSPKHGKGVWAPSLRYHDNLYYIYWGDPDFGIFMITAEDPAGKWSEPELVKPGKGMIDPTPLWDEDGKVYLAHGWAGSRSGFNSVITMFELNSDGTRPVSDEVMVFDGNDGKNHTVEGPKLYKRNGYYYMFAPAGGVEQGWQLVMRSENIYGPYESRIVMAQGTTDINGPHQGALVDTPDGKSWFLHFQDKDAYGRVLHLNPVEWKDNWPVIGQNVGTDCGEPVSKHSMPLAGTAQKLKKEIRDDFGSVSLAPQWEWAGNYKDWFGFPTSYGYFHLNSFILPTANTNLWEVPNLLLQKFPAGEFTVTANMTLCCKGNAKEVRAGLVIFGYDYGYIGLEKEGNDFRVMRGICKESQNGTLEDKETEGPELKAEEYEAGLYPNLACTVWLRAKVKKGALATFEYSTDGKTFKTLGKTFTAGKGKWVGAKTGIFCVSGPGEERAWVNVNSFDITDCRQ